MKQLRTKRDQQNTRMTAEDALGTKMRGADEEERDGFEKERDSREKERSGREKERSGREKERSDHEKERSGREKERSCREKERDARKEKRIDHEKEKSGREKKRDGVVSERDSCISEREVKVKENQDIEEGSEDLRKSLVVKMDAVKKVMKVTSDGENKDSEGKKMKEGLEIEKNMKTEREENKKKRENEKIMKKNEDEIRQKEEQTKKFSENYTKMKKNEDKNEKREENPKKKVETETSVSGREDEQQENQENAKINTEKRKDDTGQGKKQPRRDINANENPSNKNNSTVRKEETGVEHRGLQPPDGGWGWMVAIGSFMITLLLPSLGPCFGVLFSEYLLAEETSSTITAWIFNVQCFMWNVGGLMARPLIKEFGWRRIGVSGAAVLALGLFISAFTPSPAFLFFSFSLLTGVGGGAVVAICFTILPLYFVKRRGVANAIMMAGVCMGQIVGPPFARFLQAEFGQVGATMILGAVFLHACVGASFFHPVEWHLKPVPELGDEDEEEAVEATEEKELFTKDIRLNLNLGLKHNNSNISFAESAPGDLEPDLQVIIARARLRRLEGVRSLSISSYASGPNSAYSVSTLDLAGVGTLPTQSYLEDEEETRSTEMEGKPTSCSLCHIMYRVTKGIMSDLKVLRSPRACIICLSGMLCISGYLNFLMMVPFAVTSAGLSLDVGAMCISVSALTNLIMRILSSALSDFPWFRIVVCYMTGLLVASMAMFVFTMVRTPALLLVAMAVYGSGVGCAMGLYNLVMIDVLGMERLPTVFGASCFTVGTGFICLGPFIGFIRDWSGSYRVSITFTSFMLLLAFLLWLLMPLATRFDARRESKRVECNSVA